MGINYEWLKVLGHGELVNVWYKEPVDTGEWKLYTDEVWKTHCDVIDHGKNLFESHMEAFVNPETAFAGLVFEDGTLLEPGADFYILEEEYFRTHD